MQTRCHPGFPRDHMSGGTIPGLQGNRGICWFCRAMIRVDWVHGEGPRWVTDEFIILEEPV